MADLRGADEPVLIVVDLGKSHCRVEARAGDRTLAAAAVPGAPGLAEQEGADRAFAAVTAAVRKIDPNLLGRCSAMGIGAAGVHFSPEAARELAQRLHAGFTCNVALTSDAVAAHAGAFAGAAGTLLVAGTGAVAFCLTPGGQWHRADGWGPHLGDDGGGQWIGRCGLAAAVASADGRAPETSLRLAAESISSLEQLPAWIAESGSPARQLASFAPAVLEHAAAGDSVAQRIVEDATGSLARTAAAAAAAAAAAVRGPASDDVGDQATDGAVAVVGGLFDNPYFRTRLLVKLAEYPLSFTPALGSPLDGAALISVQSDLPHEGHIRRESAH